MEMSCGVEEATSAAVLSATRRGLVNPYREDLEVGREC